MAPYPTDAAGHRRCADAPARDRAKRRGCGRGPAGRVGDHGGEGSVARSEAVVTRYQAPGKGLGRSSGNGQRGDSRGTVAGCLPGEPR